MVPAWAWTGLAAGFLFLAVVAGCRGDAAGALSCGAAAASCAATAARRRT